MEMLASCKSLVENGIMVRQSTLHNRADWNTEYAFDDIETWEEISTLIAMYLEVKKIKLITKNPRLQASKHQNHILSDLLPLPSDCYLPGWKIQCNEISFATLVSKVQIEHMPVDSNVICIIAVSEDPNHT